MNESISIIQTLIVEQFLTPTITALGLMITSWLSFKSNSKLHKNSDAMQNTNQEFLGKIDELNTDLNSKMDKLNTDLLDLKLQFTVKVVNGTSLRQKLMDTLDHTNWDSKFEVENDLFKVFFTKILIRISEYFIELRSKDVVLGYTEKEHLLGFVKTHYNTTNFRINLEELLELAEKLLDEYSQNRTGNKDKDMDLVLELTKIILRKSYVSYMIELNKKKGIK